jgi:hypothetical protein
MREGKKQILQTALLIFPHLFWMSMLHFQEILIGTASSL